MVAFTLHLLGWLACALFRFFVICGTIYGIYSFIKDKWEWWMVSKHEKEVIKREDDKKREEVSKDIDTGLSLEEYKLMRMTPEERAEYEKTQAKIKKDKKIVIIMLCIMGCLLLAGIIVSFFDK